MREQVGRYIIKGQLGKGAMGVVYLADDPLLNRQAAIKTVDLSVDDAAEREFLRGRLLRDARAAAGLTHPNIVSVYDVVEEPDAAYLVLEFVPGDTLAARLNTTPIPDTAFTIHVLRGMAAALDYTHARGIIHRDIKPANVMIDPAGTPKIMDFGIARIADSRTNTPTGMVMGTVDYMSPEQIKGEALDGRSDQFALAAVAARMLTGQTLYGQHSLPTLAYKIVNEAVPQMRARNASLPPAVDTVLGKALAKTAAERFATCGQFVQDLATALAMNVVEPPTRTVAMPAAPTPAAPAQKSGAMAGILAFLAVLAAAGVGVAVWQPWKHSAPQTVAPAAVVKTAEAPPLQTPPVVVETPPPVTVEKKETAVKTGSPSKAVTPTKTVASPPPTPTPEPEMTTLSQDTPAEEEKPPADAPKPAVAAYERGKQLSQDHKFAAAVEAFSQALAIRGGYPLARFYRGRAYQQMNNCEAAIQDFDTMLKARPKYIQGYTYRGLCEIHLKNDDAALADFEQALALNGQQGMALYGRGVVRNHRGGYRKALDDLNAAIGLMPGYPFAYQARAVARRNLGDKAGASADDAKASDLLAAGRGRRGG